MNAHDGDLRSTHEEACWTISTNVHRITDIVQEIPDRPLRETQDFINVYRIDTLYSHREELSGFLRGDFSLPLSSQIDDILCEWFVMYSATMWLQNQKNTKIWGWGSRQTGMFSPLPLSLPQISQSFICKAKEGSINQQNGKLYALKCLYNLSVKHSVLISVPTYLNVFLGRLNLSKHLLTSHHRRTRDASAVNIMNREWLTLAWPGHSWVKRIDLVPASVWQ